MGKRRLPIGIQNFREIRERNCFDVDKTAYAARLVEQGITTSCPDRDDSARACSWIR